MEQLWWTEITLALQLTKVSNVPVQTYTASLGLDRYQYSHLFTFNLIYRSISLMIIKDILNFWADFWAAFFFSNDVHIFWSGYRGSVVISSKYLKLWNTVGGLDNDSERLFKKNGSDFAHSCPGIWCSSPFTFWQLMWTEAWCWLR